MSCFILPQYFISECFSIRYGMYFQVCEQCQNVKYEREGYFVTVDIEKGMQDGQVSFKTSFCKFYYYYFGNVRYFAKSYPILSF